MKSSALSLPELLAPVATGLEEMRTILGKELTEDGEVGKRVEYLARFRGKELRAALVLLCGQAVDNPSQELPQVAAVLELIHLATLVHDDVLDGADLRRNLPSVHAKWDEQTAILLGDMLYSRAFHLSTRLDSILAARLLSQCAQRICQGEIEQASLRYRFDLDQERYEAIASAKTAELYSAACELGARYPADPRESSSPEAKELAAFGRELGLAFQIIDDVLDLEGEQRVVGKRVGNDVEDGKVTLPVLHVFGQADPQTQRAIRGAYQDPDLEERLPSLMRACDLTPGLDYAKARAEELLNSALERLQRLPDTEARTTLRRLAEFVQYRKR